MSQKEEREFDRKRLAELILAVEPAKNEHIAREAVDIASKWLIKAENQAVQIENLENRAQRMRGKWIEKTVAENPKAAGVEEWQSCKCSNCGRYDTRPYMYYFDEPKYCSWCGSDMREKK